MSKFMESVNAAAAAGKGMFDVCMDPLMHMIGAIDERLSSMGSLSFGGMASNLFGGGGDGYIVAPTNTGPDVEPVSLSSQSSQSAGAGQGAGMGAGRSGWVNKDTYVQETFQQSFSAAEDGFRAANIDPATIVPPGTVAPTLAAAKETTSDLPEAALCSAYIEKPIMGTDMTRGQSAGLSA